MYNVFIEPGHDEFTYLSGGKMIKASDGLFREFNDFNVKVVNGIAERFKNHKIICIRQLEYDNNKVDMKLSQRIAYINKHGSKNDLVLAIHANYNDNPCVGGVDYFYVSEAGMKFIVIHKKNSLNNSIPYHNTYKCVRGTWTEFGIILNTIPPAVLLELGYFSNAYDRKCLKSTEYQKQCIESICQSILEYFNVKEEKKIEEKIIDDNSLKFMKYNKLILGKHDKNDYVKYDELNVILERFKNMR